MKAVSLPGWGYPVQLEEIAVPTSCEEGKGRCFYRLPYVLFSTYLGGGSE